MMSEYYNTQDRLDIRRMISEYNSHDRLEFKKLLKKIRLEILTEKEI